MNNIIFLDVDGVLNGDYMYSLGRRRPSCQGYLGIGAKHIKLLKTIVDATKAKIVLVSSWKYDYNDYIKNDKTNLIGKYLYSKLKKYGLKISSTTLCYDFSFGNRRGVEINSYLLYNKVDNYVVLDDEEFRDYDENIMKHLVLTDYILGLTEKDCEKAIDILKGNY